jgi:hypothetical protein
MALASTIILTKHSLHSLLIVILDLGTRMRGEKGRVHRKQGER